MTSLRIAMAQPTISGDARRNGPKVRALTWGGSVGLEAEPAEHITAARLTPSR